MARREEETKSKLSKAGQEEKSKLAKLTVEVNELKKELSLAKEAPQIDLKGEN